MVRVDVCGLVMACEQLSLAQETELRVTGGTKLMAPSFERTTSTRKKGLRNSCKTSGRVVPIELETVMTDDRQLNLPHLSIRYANSTQT